MSKLILTAQDALIHALTACARIGGHADAMLITYIQSVPQRVPVTTTQIETQSLIATEMLAADEGLDTHFTLLAQSYSDLDRARILFAHCVEFVASAQRVSPEEMRYLERLGDQLALDRLARSAIEFAARLRYREV